ncbi:Ras-related protein R-Ras [Frankliniella fusca]|uniref:Ras-related protein R-Ras n=1 Tax=Frankliniella fusca TaxID=407009 RepID=A0AAE1L7W2_9NEOP|nr:Ras-related protein R-Ras [Frankliniella fusca]
MVCKRDKVEHGLTFSDLDKDDKMDFNSSVKICSIRVAEVMEIHVPGSEGTQAYLMVMRFIMESCLDENLSASEKVYKIWYALFFLRYWKAWLLNHSNYSVSENFVTYNAYMCVEIIAHALIILIVKFRNENRPGDALFELFNSQHCESFLRYARSMTTTLSTVINFSMHEFLHKVRRIDILQNIISKLRGNLTFPRDKRKYLCGLLQAEKLSSSYLPNNDEIQDIVMQAQSDVMRDLRKLGVKCEAISLAKVKASVLNSRNIQAPEVDDAPSNYISEFNEDDIPLDLLSAFPTEDDVPNLNMSEVDTTPTLPANSPFVYVPNASNNLVMMKKSTFCWSLSMEGTALCKERLLRVRGKVHAALKNNCQRLGQSADRSQPTSRREEVEIGEHVIFKEGSKYFVGQIMSFSYLSGASRGYSLLTAPTSPPKGKTPRGLGCLCVLYNINGHKLKEMIPYLKF